MKAAAFSYARATSIADALQLLARHGDDAKVLSGGQSLMPALNLRLARPAILVDIGRLSELRGVTVASDKVTIGALTRHVDLLGSREIADRLPLLREATAHVAHPAIRNRGTIGGNLAHADPASEMPAIVLTLGGRLRAQSARGERWIEAHDFFVGALTTALESDEMLTEVELPVAPADGGACFLEMSRRRGDFAIIGVAATVRLDGQAQCVEARIGLCNAGDGPVFAQAASRSLAGKVVGERAIAEAVALLQGAIDPAGSIHGSKDYQRHIAGVLTARALATANERARRGR
jgi:carbon-monoxide dehydrogenase medium subunit